MFLFKEFSSKFLLRQPQQSHNFIFHNVRLSVSHIINHTATIEETEVDNLENKTF